MNNSRSLVSVIIPTYSRPDNLLRAIKSVQKQTYSPIEIIVVDDNGKGTAYQKETEKLICDSIGLRNIKYIIHDINRNGSAARNTGLKAAKGEYINFLDDDDELSESKISSQVELLRKNPEYGASYTDTKILKANRIKNVINPDITTDVALILCGKCFFNTSTVLFRRSVIDELNGFDETFNRHQDYELYVRFFRKWKMIKSNCDPLIKYDTANTITNNPEKALAYLEFFLNRFKDDINQSRYANNIYYDLYNNVLINSIRNNNKTIAKYCFKKVIRNKIPSPLMVMKYIYHYLSSRKFLS